MSKFIVIGERIHATAPDIKQAFDARDPEPILARAKEQLDAGADYLDLNIGPAARGGEELMVWGVKLLQENFDNVPVVLDTANKKAIEAGIKVYNRSKGMPIVNSSDAGDRIGYLDIAAANDAKCICLCSKDGVPANNDERIQFCQEQLEHGMTLGMEPTDMLFDPLFIVIKGMQDQMVVVLEAIEMITEMGLMTTGGVSNVSNGCPPHIRPILDAAVMAMAMQCGFSSAIIDPCNKRMMETIIACDIVKNNILYADSVLEI